MRNQKGFTLLEVAVVLAVVMGILAYAIAPVAYHWYLESKIIKANSDVRNIAVGIFVFEKDMCDWPIWVDGHARTRGDSCYKVLYSHAGQHPACDGTYAKTTDWHVDLGSGLADTLENQLVRGRPGDVAGNEYPDKASDLYELHGSYYYWRGPYLGTGGMEAPGGTSLTDKTKFVFQADPWGNKYYVCVQGFHPGHLDHGSPNDEAVFIISAGPNEMLETEFSKDSRDWFPRGDDICFRIK